LPTLYEVKISFFAENIAMTIVKAPISAYERKIIMGRKKTKHHLNVTATVATGIVLGTAVGVAIKSMRRPPTRSERIKKNTSMAIDTVGQMISNLADFAR